jgi:hypothetical protein
MAKANLNSESRAEVRKPVQSFESIPNVINHYPTLDHKIINEKINQFNNKLTRKLLCDISRKHIKASR